MSFKASLIKTGIKLTPNMLVRWVANFVLKDIAKLQAFNFDIDSRILYLQIQLMGESETIDVWLEDFEIIPNKGKAYQFVLHQGKSNRLWLHNLLARISGKKLKIPHVPKLEKHIGSLAELLHGKQPTDVEQ
jgi:hypothetical protein